MAKIDWDKAGHHEFDPARVQQVHDFITPDDPIKKKGKKARSLAPLSDAALIAQREAQAFRQHLVAEAARIRSETDVTALPKKARAARKRISIKNRPAATCKAEITQAEILSALGFPRSKRKPKNWGDILKGLVADGVLLDTGQPNVDHPKIIAIINDKIKSL